MYKYWDVKVKCLLNESTWIFLFLGEVEQNECHFYKLSFTSERVADRVHCYHEHGDLKFQVRGSGSTLGPWISNFSRSLHASIKLDPQFATYPRVTCITFCVMLRWSWRPKFVVRLIYLAYKFQYGPSYVNVSMYSTD